MQSSPERGDEPSHAGAPKFVAAAVGTGGARLASWEDQVLMKDVLAVVLAGGRGERLGPLTRDRAKPAVPFGGIYRIIDFTLSNCLNSGCGGFWCSRSTRR